jgi:hypothetical protein
MKEEIKDILESKDLKEITNDVVEKVLDNQITDEFLKEVPVVKSLIALKNMYSSISDKIFIKKAMKVLLELGDTTGKERAELLVNLNDEHESGSEKILMAIDKLETMKKCIVFGRLCKLKALNKIDINSFLRLTKILQDSYLDDLYDITYFTSQLPDKVTPGENAFIQIIALGLIYQYQTEQKPIRQSDRLTGDDPEYIGGEIEFYYLLSDTGEILLKYYYDLFPERLLNEKMVVEI